MRSSVGASPVLPPLAGRRKAPANALPVRYTEAGFCFLNRTVNFGSTADIDWNYAPHGKLWTYNLNYFEYLRQPGLDPDTGEQLIAAWVAAEATHRDGWEPYPTSLRLVNWLQFYRTVERPIPTRVHGSVRRQYVNLRRKIEYHLAGNHLLENALALALTARYLNDAPGRQQADRLLSRQLREQYLPDGSHYERSILYHLVLLWRQLDVYSWVAEEDGPLAKQLRTTLEKQLAYGHYVVLPNGRFPHFNDSVGGIAPQWGRVEEYRRALGVSFPALLPGRGETRQERQRAGERLREKQFIGYRVWSFSAKQTTPSVASALSPASPLSPAAGSGERIRAQRAPDSGSQARSKKQDSRIKNHLFIAANPLAPDHIPGHAHAHSLTFCVFVRGEPVVIDPAVSTYEKNERRAWERSTRAHNTVTVAGDRNSSDVWGGFRVGRRAPTTVIDDRAGRLSVRHDGYPGTAHLRTWEHTGEGFTVTDRLKGRYETGTARLHFAPGLDPVLDGKTVSVVGCTFTFAGAAALELFDYEAATGWNTLAAARGLRVVFRQQLLTHCVLPVA